jgi:hypothetical protein
MADRWYPVGLIPAAFTAHGVFDGLRRSRAERFPIQ